jgi:hypothetical protein
MQLRAGNGYQWWQKRDDIIEFGYFHAGHKSTYYYSLGASEYVYTNKERKKSIARISKENAVE